MVPYSIIMIFEMNIEKIFDFNNYISGISIEMDGDDEFSGSVNYAQIPFPQCKIMQVSHSSFFTDRPSMARDFKLEGDEILGSRDSADFRTFWVPLSDQDDWWTIIEKTAELSKLSGDRHHIRLEGYSVVGDILIPNFGS